MTDPITPKALHDALVDADKQRTALKRIIAAFNSRPETRDAVVEALGIKDLDRNALCGAIDAGYAAISERAERLNDTYVHGIVTLPEKPN